MRRLIMIVGCLVGAGVLARAAVTVARAKERRDEYTAMVKTRPVPDWKNVGREGHSDRDDQAAVTVVVFTDYQCPVCQGFSWDLDALRRERSAKELRVVYRHFPMAAVHRFARAAAYAAECAGRQGRYQPFHDALYASQAEIGVRPWSAFAKDANISDVPGFLACMADSATIGAIARDSAVGTQLGIPGTPSFLVNDSLYIGTRRGKTLETIVNGAARRVSATAVQE